MSSLGVVGEIVLADRSDMVSEPISEGTGVRGCLHIGPCLVGDRTVRSAESHTTAPVPRVSIDRWELSMYSLPFVVGICLT